MTPVSDESVLEIHWSAEDGKHTPLAALLKTTPLACHMYIIGKQGPGLSTPAIPFLTSTLSSGTFSQERSPNANLINHLYGQ